MEEEKNPYSHKEEVSGLDISVGNKEIARNKDT